MRASPKVCDPSKVHTRHWLHPWILTALMLCWSSNDFSTGFFSSYFVANVKFHLAWQHVTLLSTTRVPVICHVFFFLAYRWWIDEHFAIDCLVLVSTDVKLSQSNKDVEQLKTLEHRIVKRLREFINQLANGDVIPDNTEVWIYLDK